MGQRTFTLIPKFPGRDESTDKQPLRPMTSKQVRNAYKAANKGPKLTRAEQWKQEKAEQERIKKEFEREKAAAKARVARDKKKEKELAEKEEKRKKRIPLVNVRPSQETISWFVRGNGSAKKRDAQGKEVEKTNTTMEENNDNTEKSANANDDNAERPFTKLRKLENIQEDDEEEDFDAGDVGMETRPQELAPTSSPAPPNVETPQEETKEDDMAEVTDDLLAAAEPQLPLPKQPLPEIELDGMDDELDDFEEDLALGILEDIEAAMDKPNTHANHAINAASGFPSKPDSMAPQTPTDNIRALAPNRYAEDLGLRRPSSPTFIKPPLPQKSPRNPKAVSSSPPRQEPPMSTQAILYNLDDFFPSSSQQARELEQDLDDDDDLMPSAPLHLASIAEEEEEFEEEDEQLGKSPEQSRLPILDPAPDSPPPPPRRFFTSSGSHERMCLALQRSRRTAALEKIQQRERARIQAGVVQRAQAETRKVTKSHESTKKPPMVSKPPPQNNQLNHPRQPPMKAPNALQQKPHTNTSSTPKPMDTPKQPRQLPPRTSLTPHNKPLNNNAQTPKRVEPLKHDAPASLLPQETKENRKPSQEPFALSASQESYGGDWVDDIALELMI